MPAPAIKTDSPFWQLPVTALLEQLSASHDGLSSAEAALRLTRFGPNLIHGERKKALILQFLAKFKNPLVVILLTASALSAFTGDATSFFIIGTIVLISVTLDFVQEYRAGQAADRLRQSVAVRGQVLRNGKLLEIPLADMAYLAVRGSGAVNGVSRLHGEVSRGIFQSLFPHWPEIEVPVGHVTNGVHMPSWDSAEADALWTDYCGKERWLGMTEALGEKIRCAPDDKLWQLRADARKSLVGYVRERLSKQLAASGATPEEIGSAQHISEYYSRDRNGIPVAWVARIRESMARLTTHFSSNRTVRQYTEHYYIPAAAAYHERAADKGEAGAQVVAWQHALDRGWANLRFGEVAIAKNGDQHIFEVQVYLNGLDPDAVQVELYAEGVNGGDPVRKEMTCGPKLVGAENGYVYGAQVQATRSATDYTTRVIPHRTGIAVPLEAAHILWQR